MPQTDFEGKWKRYRCSYKDSLALKIASNKLLETIDLTVNCAKRVEYAKKIGKMKLEKSDDFNLEANN